MLGGNGGGMLGNAANSAVSGALGGGMLGRTGTDT